MRPEGWQGPGPAGTGWGGFRASGGQVRIGPRVWEDVEVRGQPSPFRVALARGFWLWKLGLRCATLRQTPKTGSGLGEGLEATPSVLSRGI